jgi:hypothetical protein
MSAMTLFGQKPASVLNKFQGIENSITDSLVSSGFRRISIDGSVFREMVGGKEVRVNEDRAMNVAIVGVSNLSRIWYGNVQYVKGQKTKPMCWSSDAEKPSPDVPEAQRQATSCRNCKQDIKGSGQGDSKACRFQRRIAVMLDGEIEQRKVYQITLPSTSIFGDSDNGKMPLHAYALHCKSHSTPIEAIVTELRFDTASSTPKLIFKEVRFLTDSEADVVLEMRSHEDTIRATTFNVSQMDGVIDPPKLEAPKAEPKPEPKAEPKPEVKAEEPVEEPKKVVKKSTPAPEPVKDADLADIVGEWDD